MAKKEARILKRALILALTCVVLSVSTAASQTHRRTRSSRSTRSSHSRPKPPTTSYADKQQAEIKAGRERIAGQIKALTQFLYLLAGISKGIDTAEQVNRNHEDSSAALSADQITLNRTKVRESIRNVRVGLDQLEASFRNN